MKQSKGLNELYGIKTYGLSVGLKKSGKNDIAFISSEFPLATVGVFTKNRVKAAPVVYAQELLPSDNIRLFIINSGIANALTGRQGMMDLRKIIDFYTRTEKLPEDSVIMSSTGLIGKRLDVNKICAGYGKLKTAAASSATAALAIMTTDKEKKIGYRSVKIDGKNIEIAYMAKGSGMISPDLATMLVFIGTDVNLPSEMLNRDLVQAVNETINHITVDGDMSTNDSVFLFSTQKGAKLSDAEHKVWRRTLTEVCCEIAESIVRDGEGATKFVRIDVKNAYSVSAARKIALNVANSLLVKTALFGEDANIGRIAAACGSAKVRFSPGKLDILINGVKVITHGQPADSIPGGLLTGRDIKIEIRLNNGNFSYYILTSDLSYEYVRINAEYHT